MSVRTFCLLGCATLVVSTLAGCGAKDPLGRKAISGSVTLNGSPVAQGNIMFEPVGTAAVTSSGSVITAGKFAIEQEFGLPPGKFVVRINVPKPGTGGTFDANTLPGVMLEPPEEMAPPDWNTNSKQSIEVKPDGPFEYNFDIKAKK